MTHVPAAERIEPGHRLVEEEDLGVVEEGLRQAEALQHALRELAQGHRAFVANARPVEHLGRTAAPFGRAIAKQTAK